MKYVGIGGYTQATTTFACDYYAKDIEIGTESGGGSATVTVDSDLVCTGNITKSYAFANWNTNTLITALPTAGNYLPITGSTWVPENQLKSADMNVAFQNNIPFITYNGTATKMFHVVAAITGVLDSLTGVTIEFRLYKNGSQYPMSCVQRKMDANTTDPAECTLNTLIELSTGDNLTILMRNLTNSTGVLIRCLNFVVTQI